MKRNNFGYDLGKLFNAEQTVSCKMIPRYAILIQLLFLVSLHIWSHSIDVTDVLVRFVDSFSKWSTMHQRSIASWSLDP